jgi:hypothetical protein
MPSADWNAVYNAFNPFASIPIDRLDAWYVERPHAPRAALITRLNPQKGPQRILLVGDPSSGKTTELTKLATELQLHYDALVIRLDVEQKGCWA